MRKIGAVVFPGFELLDLFGPMQMFGMLPEQFELTLVSQTSGAVASKQALSAHSHVTFDSAPRFDVLFVPGGGGTRREVDNPALLQWLEEAAGQSEYVLSVCTGSALLAKAGLLDGRRATTNKMAFDWVSEQGPKVHWVKQARWVEDGRFITSSGVSAGMDMALGAISAMHGRELAEKVANWCEYTWQQDKDADPFAKLHGLV